MSESIFNPTLVTTGRTYKPGQRMRDVNGEEYIFVQADSAITANRVVVVTEDYKAQNITGARADPGDLVGVAKTAIPDESYGWVSIWGKGDVQAAATAAANSRLYTMGNPAGQVDDATSSQQHPLAGIVLTTTRGASAGTTAAVWSYPTVAV